MNFPASDNRAAATASGRASDGLAAASGRPHDGGRTINKWRKVADDHIDRHQYSTALFWSDKVLSLSSASSFVTSDVLRYARCLYLTQQFHRCAHQIQSRNLEKTDLDCCYLAARAIHEAKDHEEALAVLDHPAAIELVEKSRKKASRCDDDKIEAVKRTLSSISLLRGRVLEALDNRALAAEAFKLALTDDVYCQEAFQALVHHQMLTAGEESALLSALPFDEQCGGGLHAPPPAADDTLCGEKCDGDGAGDTLLVRALYSVSLKKYERPDDFDAPSVLSRLGCNTDLLIARAERHYYNCDYNECHRLTSAVMKADPFHSGCLPIHITCLIELNKSNALFHLAHRLVDIYPEWCVSWFAVGCYYFLVGKHEAARRYLSKSTQLERVFGPAWLVYGHSFAKENEHDQAMAAYFKACQLMRGCHLPLLYIGVEYSLTNNSKLAERFFAQSLAIAPQDPFVLHEMAAISFQNGDFEAGESYCLDALRSVQRVRSSVLSSKWEALLNNLGHISRKLGKYDAALDYHRQALVLVPLSASTYAAIGYVHALMGHLLEAVEAFHKALGMRRDDTFSTTMLNNVIEQLMSEVPPFPGYPQELPKFTSLLAAKDDERCRPEKGGGVSGVACGAGGDDDGVLRVSAAAAAASAATGSPAADASDLTTAGLDIDMADVTGEAAVENET